MYTPTRIITAHEYEPVTLDEVKTHLRGISHSEHDELLIGLIVSARESLENLTARSIVQRTVAAMFQAWPQQYFELPLPPIQTVSSVKYTDIDGTESTMSSDEYSVDIDSEPGRVVLGYSETWPSESLHAPDYPIEITYVAGDEVGFVPESIKTAIKFMVEKAYDKPPEQYANTIDQAVDALISPYRVWGF